MQNVSLRSFYQETSISIELKKKNLLNVSQILTNKSKGTKFTLKVVSLVFDIAHS